MRTVAAPALLTLALLLGAAGCGENTDSGSTATPEPTTSQTTGAPESTQSTESTDDAEGTESSDPPFPEAVAPADGGYGSGNGLGLTDVRVASHDGYDRVVFELGGTGTPGWYVDYVDEPVSDGSGEPVALEGTTYLQVGLRAMGLPFDTGIPAYGDATTRVPGAGGITEVAPGGVFEGDQLAFVGLSGEQQPFRVFALTNPTRVVVDVRSE